MKIRVIFALLAIIFVALHIFLPNVPLWIAVLCLCGASFAGESSTS